MNGKIPVMQPILAFALSCLLLLANSDATAQAPTLTARFSPVLDNNINGFWEYLPRNYTTDAAQTYPLLIFIHGNGDRGDVPVVDTLRKVLNAGTPKIIGNRTFPDSFYTGGKWYKFIVLAPQIKVGFNGDSSTVLPSTIDAVINYARANYRVDTSRIYLGGLSMGGGATWNYAGSSLAAARKLAAISVAAGAADLNILEAGIIAGANLPVIATHNTIDDLVAAARTQVNIQLIKLANPAVAPLAIYWNTPGPDNDKHNVWNRTYESLLAGTTPGGSLPDTMGVTIYEWMLQYARPQSSLPLTWKSFKADARNNTVLLKWETAQEQNILRYEAERSRDGQTWEPFATVLPKSSSDSIKQYTLSDNAPYADITYYRIKQIDLDGRFSYSVIEKWMRSSSFAKSLRVYPSPFKQALTINFFYQEKQVIDVRLSNAAGALVRQQRFYLAGSGEQTLVWNNLNGLQRGVYLIEIADGSGAVLARKKILK